MTELTRRQRQSLDRHRRLILDLADVVDALTADIVATHEAAALLTSSDSPRSGWSDGSGHGSAGSHSDPTLSAVISDEPVSRDLDVIGDRLRDVVDAAQRLHDLTRRIVGRLNRGDGTEAKRQGDDLHDANIGRGSCSGCDRHCDGQGHDRLRTVRSAGTLRDEVELRFCDACYQGWRYAVAKDPVADIWAWCDMRRRRVERMTDVAG